MTKLSNQFFSKSIVFFFKWHLLISIGKTWFFGTNVLENKKTTQFRRNIDKQYLYLYFSYINKIFSVLTNHTYKYEVLSRHKNIFKIWYSWVHKNTMTPGFWIYIVIKIKNFLNIVFVFHSMDCRNHINSFWMRTFDW